MLQEFSYLRAEFDRHKNLDIDHPKGIAQYIDRMELVFETNLV